ncbi:hypothetical protein IPA_03650 [Ignicoccus pacificus DSM 13166]|uniref:tRNA(Phe) 7-((3-amino-3-carboxypropyl)-4-demethylwyosine(37)-N(4))-methyltransferase n=1 Tax=Ignicoccus pacificus DSM 13166 TaxID=940294 RepID=A0A977K9E0_9CREN|nr:hypothetical protein IPA_03650 [Ignicoccus pacificus DSM 13166]
MKEDIEIGYMDSDIVTLIEKFFKLPYVYTKSSCSGRIVAVDSPYPWSREGTIIFKVHRPIKLDELKDILSKKIVTRLWINSMGPIIHAVAKDFDSAFKIIQIARDAGFKHSGVLSVNEEGWVVELTTGVRANILAKVDDKVILKEEELDKICETINDVLLEGKKRLKMLEERLDAELKGLK